MARGRKDALKEESLGATPPGKTQAQSLINVEGRAKRPQSFNLPHDTFCRAMGTCSCTTMTVSTTVWSPGDQQRHLRSVEKLVCSSFSIGHRGVVTMPRAVLDCPEVKAALEKGWLRQRS